MRSILMAVTAAAASLCATSAWGEFFSIGSLPPKGEAEVTGMIDTVNTSRSFTMHDTTGSITVVADKDILVKEGDRITATGQVKKGPVGPVVLEAEAQDVENDTQTAMEDDGISNPVRMPTGKQTSALQAEEAQAMHISELPKKGKVEVSGTVDSVRKDYFTLLDSTGRIKVKSAPAQKSVRVASGEEVTVVGFMNGGFMGLGKKIEATQIIPASGSAQSRNANQ